MRLMLATALCALPALCAGAWYSLQGVTVV
jgi:hypothetical protein